MASCPPEMLEDLAAVFAELRRWAGVVEKKPGVDYAGRQPFLHFHLLQGGKRRADIKGRNDWKQIDLPFPVPVSAQTALLGQLRRQLAERRS